MFTFGYRRTDVPQERGLTDALYTFTPNHSLNSRIPCSNEVEGA